MTLSAADSLAPFDMTDTAKLDLSEVLSAIINADTFLFGKIKWGKPATQLEHKWVQDALNPTTVQFAAALDISATSIAVDDASKIRVGCLLQNTAATKRELLQVVGITGNTLTLATRGYGSSTACTHADDSVMRIVGQAVQMGDENVGDISRARTIVSNYTQGFKTYVKIADEMKQQGQAGVPDEVKYQIGQRMLELKRELAIAYMYSRKSATVGSDTVYSSFEGLVQWLEGASGNKRDCSAAGQYTTLSEDALNQSYRDCWDEGATPTFFCSHADQIKKLCRLAEDKVRLAPSDRARGLFVNKFLTETGEELDLAVDRWIRTDEAVLLDLSRLSMHPYGNMNIKMEQIARVGNADKYIIYGRFTNECRNADEAHALRYNLTV